MTVGMFNHGRRMLLDEYHMAFSREQVFSWTWAGPGWTKYLNLAVFAKPA